MSHQQTSREALESLKEAAPNLRELVADYIRNQGRHGATDFEIERALDLRHQTASSRRRALVQRGEVTDSGERRKTDSGRNAIVWVSVQHDSHTTAKKTMQEPEHPLQATQRGHAMAAAALALDVLTGVQRRLLWCVDLDQVPGARAMYDPTKPDDTPWAQLLDRFKGALDRQPWHTGTTAKLGMVVNYTDLTTHNRLQAVFTIPWNANLSVLTGYPPPVGVWLVWPLPPLSTDDMGRETTMHEGDQLPDIWWYEDIPF